MNNPQNFRQDVQVLGWGNEDIVKECFSPQLRIHLEAWYHWPKTSCRLVHLVGWGCSAEDRPQLLLPLNFLFSPWDAGLYHFGFGGTLLPRNFLLLRPPPNLREQARGLQ
jgi:hypothetical protein